MNWKRLQRRRARRVLNDPRGTVCESRMWTGPHRWSYCPFRARFYQQQNDIFVCGIHARAYVRLEPSAPLVGTIG